MSCKFKCVVIFIIANVFIGIENYENVSQFVIIITIIFIEEIFLQNVGFEKDLKD